MSTKSIFADSTALTSEEQGKQESLISIDALPEDIRNGLQDIRMEAQQMAQDREVQNMIIQERYDRMDWLTYGAEQEAKGEARGIIKGEDKLASLISQLFALGRNADAEKAANDALFRAQLFKEFNMLD